MRYWIIIVAASALLVLGICGCNSAHKIKLSQVSPPARTTIENLTAGGNIEKIEKETSNGKTIYDVEASINGKAVEYDVADNGDVLTSEESISYDTMPSLVKEASEKYFGSSRSLNASKELENGQKFFEVEGKKNGEAISIKMDDKGNILEEEKD